MPVVSVLDGASTRPAASRGNQLLRHPFAGEFIVHPGLCQRMGQCRGRRNQALRRCDTFAVHPILDVEEPFGRPALQMLEQRKHLFLVNRAANVQQLAPHLGIPVVFDGVLHEPTEQLGQVLVLSHLLQHPIHGCLQQAARIQLNAKVMLQLEVGGKSPDQAPDKLVERHDGQFSKVPVQRRAHRPSAAAKLINVQAGLFRQSLAWSLSAASSASTSNSSTTRSFISWAALLVKVKARMRRKGRGSAEARQQAR